MSNTFCIESDAEVLLPWSLDFTVKPESWAKFKCVEAFDLSHGGSTFTDGGDGADIDPLRRNSKPQLQGS